MAEEQKPKVDPLKELKGTPQNLTPDEFGAFIRERAKNDPRYRRGGSRWKERGE